MVKSSLERKKIRCQRCFCVKVYAEDVKADKSCSVFRRKWKKFAAVTRRYHSIQLMIFTNRKVMDNNPWINYRLKRQSIGNQSLIGLLLLLPIA